MLQRLERHVYEMIDFRVPALLISFFYPCFNFLTFCEIGGVVDKSFP